MQYKCKVTVIDKKLYPELQAQYCADPQVGACPCYNVGDTFLFERYGLADDFWHMGLGTLASAGRQTDGIAGSSALPHCSEAWDAIGRYIYTALQGGSIMRGWMRDERVMIACCSDGTRPVIFKIERLDYKVLYIDGCQDDTCAQKIAAALKTIAGVNAVEFRPAYGFTEVYLEEEVGDDVLRETVESCGAYTVTKIE